MENWQKELDLLKKKLALAKKGENYKITKTKDQMGGTTAGETDRDKQINRENYKKEYLAHVAESVNLVTHTLSKPAKYFKPAFLLENLTPYLSVELITLDDKGAEQFTNLFSSEKDPAHNNLKGFNYIAGDGGKIEINLADVDQSVLELLAYRYAQLSTLVGTGSSATKLRVVYGWQQDESIKKEYGRYVHLTRELNVVWNKLEASYDAAGVSDVKLEGLVQVNMPDPYGTHRPFMKLGTAPIQATCLFQLLEIVMKFFAIVSTQTKASTTFEWKEKDKVTWTPAAAAVVTLSKYFYFELGVRNFESLKHHLSAIMRYYFDDPPITIQFDKYINKKTIKETGEDKVVIGVDKRGNYHTYATKKKGEKAKVPGSYGALKNRHYQYRYNLYDVSNPLTANDKPQGGQFSTILQSMDYSAMASRIAAGESAIDDSTRNTKTKDELVNILSEKNPKIALREYLKKVQKDKSNKSYGAFAPALLDKMISCLTAIAGEMYVHPYLVYEQTKTAFKDVVASYNNSLNKDGNEMANYQKMIVADIKLISDQYVGPTGVIEYEPAQRASNEMMALAADMPGVDSSDFSADSNKTVFVWYDEKLSTKMAKEKWCSLAKNYNVSQNESWPMYLDTVANQIKFKIPPTPEMERQEKRDRLKDKKSEKAKVKAKRIAERDTYYMNSNNFVAGPDEAFEVIKSLVFLQEKKLQVEEPIPKGQRNQDQRVGGSKGSTSEKIILDNLKAVQKQLWSNKNGDRKQVMMIIADINNSKSLFNSSYGQQNIVQAYSYRAAAEDFTNDPYNPGWPTVSDINFPDVISFDVELDYQHATQSLAHNAEMQIQVKQGQGFSAENTEMQMKNDLKDLIEGIAKQSSTAGNKAAKIKLKADIKQVDELMADYEKRLRNTKGETVPAPPYSMSANINLPITSQSRSMYTGQTGEVLALKKQMQELRKKIVFSAATWTATLKVVGDPSFQLNDCQSKFIFLKFIRPDGALSMFTNVYQLVDFEQEISSGNFITTLKLRSTPSRNDDAAGELSDLWSKYDKIDITSKK